MVKNYSKAMILGREIPLNVVESNGDTSFTESDGFSLYNEEFIDASTPRRGRSVSYLELTSPCNEVSLLSDTSLQRMRCLSQSISDMKILREKQQERKHEIGELLNNDFLKEHARKLRDARDKIKMLEAKYQSQQRTRTKFETSSLDKKRRSSGLEGRNESLVFTGNTGEEETDGYSGSLTQVQNVSTQEQNEITQLSSFGSNRQRMMGRIPENLDWNRNCCYGDEGSTTHHLTPRKHSRPNPTTTSTKWRSMPNLSTGETTSLDNRILMYGEAIPLDPTAKKHHTKFTRKSGFYKVNESAGENPCHSTKKRKFREKLFGKKGTSKSKKNSKKLVSSPTEGLALGRIVRCHPSVETAYIIELNTPDKGTFGFNIGKGYEEREDGIFVCKIVGKKAEKFLGGLLHVSDEILEINSTSVREESLAFVQKLIKNADKLELAILPYSSRKEQQMA